MSIYIQVNEKVEVLKQRAIGTNNVNTIELMFELCEEFNNLVPVALFTKNDTTYKVNIVDNKCLVPHEVLKGEGEVEFGVYGFELSGQDLVKRYSPIPTKLFIKKGSYREGQESVDASPNSFEYYLTACNNAKNDAETSENNAKSSEENAKNSEENSKISENNAQISANEVENIKNSIVTEENKRVENENARVTAENERQISEDNRIQNENARVTAENERVLAENTRIESEQIRQNEEEIRVENETTRIVAETNRNEAETIRESNEETRITNENVRVANEISREEERKVHNDMLDTLLKDMQVEGTDINVKDSADYPCELRVEGKSEQEVTENSPSPNYPSSIENVEGNLEIKVVGKNLFNINEVKQAAGETSININNNVLTLTATGTLGAQYVQYFLKNVNSEKTYIFSSKVKKTITGSNSLLRVRVDGSNDGDKYAFIKNIDNSGAQTNVEYSLSNTFSGYSHYRFFIYNNVSTPVTLGEQTKYYNMQILPLEEGTVLTTYEPYKEQKVTFPLSEGQKLMKNGYLADDGIHHKRKQIILDGTENLSKRNNTNNSFNFKLPKQSYSGICSHYKSFSSPSEIDTKNGIYLLSSNDAIFTDLRFTTVEELKTWIAEQYLAGTPVTIEYVYKNTIDREIVPYAEEQQIAWQQIKALKTYRTVTNISNNQNTNIKLIYKKDLQTQLLELENMILESGV